MRRSGLIVMAVIGVCLAFGLSAQSAQKPGAAPANAARGTAPAAIAAGRLPAPEGDPGNGGIGSIGGIGPGFGGRGYTPVQFVGVTTQRFPLGPGALALSRACNEEHPSSRLCEWSDIFRAIPPIALDGEVLAAANYDTRPTPMCLNPNGGTRCNQNLVLRPAACCGYPPPPPQPPSPASITLEPADPQSVTSCSNTFQFTATAYDANGAPMAGIPLVFEFPPVVGGTANLVGPFSPSSGLSDDHGQVSTTLTLFASSCEFNCTGAGKDCSAEILAHDLGRLIFSNPVTLLDAIP
jgi:hypothetical protein